MSNCHSLLWRKILKSKNSPNENQINLEKDSSQDRKLKQLKVSPPTPKELISPDTKRVRLNISPSSSPKSTSPKNRSLEKSKSADNFNRNGKNKKWSNIDFISSTNDSISVSSTKSNVSTSSPKSVISAASKTARRQNDVKKSPSRNSLASSSFRELSKSLSVIDRKYIDKKRESVIDNWVETDQKEEEEEAKRSAEEFFSPRKSSYKIKGINRKKRDDYQGQEEEDYEYIPIHANLPRNLSESALKYISIPVDERLMLPKEEPKARKNKHGVTEEQWLAFYQRQVEYEQWKRTRDDIEPEEPTVAKKSTIDRVYKESIIDNYPNDAPEEVYHSNAVWTNNPRILESKKENPPPPLPEQTRFISDESLALTSSYDDILKRSRVEFHQIVDKYRQSRDVINARKKMQETIDLY